MLKHKTTRFLLMVLFLIPAYGKATHLSGGDLTYKPIGNNVYELTLVVYRDCAGVPVQPSYTINCVSSSGQTVSCQVFPISGTGNEITFPCFGTSTVCSGGSLPGFQRYEYKGQVTLPPSTNWRLSWENCARNCAITTAIGNCTGSTDFCFYIEANLNNLVAPGDNSPVFTNYPVSFICIGQNFTYNHGALDAEGDSLVYSFITPRSLGGASVNFAPGFSATNFLSSSTPITLNSVTGDINLTASAFEVGITAIKIDVYRNGVWIGNVMRDIQFQVQNCSPNVLPTASGINGTTDFDTLICAGTPLCFDIFTDDQNLDQNLTVTWNQGVPGASFTTTADQFPTATFCWTPTQADARTQPYSFTIMVKDDNCSFNSFQVYSYQIYVPFVPVDSAIVVPLCDTSERGAIYLTQSGVGEPFEYLWYDGDVSPQKTNLLPGTYSVTVTNVIGCVATKEIIITPAPDKLIASVGIVDSASTPIAADGSLLGSVVGGTPPYTYQWSDGSTDVLADGLTPGFYTLTVTDSNGCISVATGQVIPKCPIASCSGTSLTCTGRNDATATVSISGSTNGLSIIWNGNPQLNTSTIRNLSPGTYTAIISNTLGCSDTCSVTIPNTPCSGFVTYTMGGYGYKPMAGNPAMYVKNNFNTVFPNGITIGCNNTIKLTNNQAVLRFLPCSGTPALLPAGHLINPSGYKNTLAGQLVAAILNVGFDSANASFAPASGNLGDLVLASSVLRGRTVREVIEIANRHIGGCDNTYPLSQLNFILTKINENYLEGNTNGCFLACPLSGSNNRLFVEISTMESPMRWSIYPNPASGEVSVLLDPLKDGAVSIELHSLIPGQALVVFKEQVMAGQSIQLHYDVRNIPSGTYLMRLQDGENVQTKRLVVVH